MILIGNGRLSAAINPLGAELTSLRDAQRRELMTDADPAYWTGHAPLLFPVVGRSSGDVIRLDGREYPMKQHGFARRMPFELVARGEASATFALTDTSETRAAYPFAFRLEVAYTLIDATLAIDVRVENRGDAIMPASFGFHPAFAWPLPYGQPREDHRIVFDREEPGRLRAIAKDGTIAPETRPSPLDGRILHLTDALFAHDALVWDPVESDTVTYGAAGGPQLRIAFPDTPRLGIWTKPVPSNAAGSVGGPGARFVCVEPWHGIADPRGYTGDFHDKPGVFKVAVGDAKRIGMSATLVP